MRESQIENSKTAASFELLYTRAITMLNDPQKKDAYTIIPDEDKKKFLNFFSLPHNEQLELISDLSKLKDLPQEMADAIHQFPYFITIPNDIFKEISSYLKRKELREDRDIISFLVTHKRPHALFQPDRLGDLLPVLLLGVATGKQDNVEKIVDMHPELLLKPGTVTDYSGRTFKDLTAYEYAYWAKDTHMCRMLEQYMDSQTKNEMLKRCEAIEKNGLTYTQHGVEVKGSKHFDFTPLKKALQNYIKCTENNKEETWMLVGMAQRDVPVHVANEYCRKDRPFDPMPKFNEDKLPRELTFHNHTNGKEELWFPLISNSAGLGVDFAVSRRGMAGATASEGKEQLSKLWQDIDFSAIARLDKVRTDDLIRSRENLRSAAPRP